MLGSRTDRTQTNPTRFAVLENHRPAVSPAKTRSDATPDRTIHFRALDSVIAKTAINGEPFGVCQRWATTSRIEYRDAVKLHARRKATPNADRTGAFAGRASRPRSMNGRISRKMTGIPLRRSPQNAALNSVLSGVPAPIVNCGKISATFSRPQENSRYQSGTINSEICGLLAGPRNGVTTAERQNMIATRRKIRTKAGPILA